MGESPRAKQVIRRLWGIVAVLLVTSAVLGVYGLSIPRGGQPEGGTPTPGLLNVLATFFPLQDWAESVGGAKASVTLIVPATQDVHDFEPTPAAIQAISTADILVMNGAGLEPWVTEAISIADNRRLVVVDCSQNISLITVPPEFQVGNRTIDPHIWLDPVIAAKMVESVLNGYIKADPADSAYFTANANSYESKLSALNQQFVDLTASHLATRSFVTFHTSFAYLAREYNLTQIPVFGPFQEEPTPADISNVVSAINRNHLLYVGYESLENPAVPRSVASQTNATLVPLDPIEGLSPEQEAEGQTYLTLMAQTLLVLTLALNHVGQ
jgi:zinc transport system substrate-binding protein